VENFPKDKSVLIKTRRVYTYLKLYKVTYNYLLNSFLINDKLFFYSLSTKYYSYIQKELTKNIWKFYVDIIPKDLGLVSSNYFKSITHITLVNSKLKSKKLTIKNMYLSNFELYQFYLKKNTFKKFIIFFLNIIPTNYYSHSVNFDIYNSYIWLNWYLKLNPMNNIFYLKVYNY
jgi:hypothetical protein